MIPFTSIACEYGPIAAGAFSVLITFFMFFPHFPVLLMFFLLSLSYLLLRECPTARLNAFLLRPNSRLITSGSAFIVKWKHSVKFINCLQHKLHIVVHLQIRFFPEAQIQLPVLSDLSHAGPHHFAGLALGEQLLLRISP